VKKLLAISIFCLVAVSAKAQVYGNGWINYSQKYFKFPIRTEGIYRLDSTLLANYFDLSSVNAKNFQVFFKGKEQFIFIKGEANDKINNGDYIEFYANPKMRETDSLIYHNIQYLPNPYLPLFSDSIYAFLTINNQTNNKRFIYETDTNSVAYPAENYFYNEKIYTNKMAYNQVGEYLYGTSDPRYTQNEAYGAYFTKGNSVSTNFSNLNPYTSAPLPSYLSLNFAGGSLNYSVSKDHRIQTLFSDQGGAPILLADTFFRGFDATRQTFTISSQNTNSNTNFTLTSVAEPAFAAFENYTFLSYIHYFYPQTLNLANNSTHKLFVDNSGGSSKGFYNFSGFNFAGSDSVFLYDITNGKRIRTVKSGAMLRAVIPNGTGRKFCFMAAESQIKVVKYLLPVNQTGNFTYLKDLSATNPFVLIYHKATKNGALQYKNHKQTVGGGNFNVISADIDELLEQFCYGIYRHPMAIRNFLKYLNDSLSTPPKYVFLIGKGVNCFDLSSDPTVQAANMIPTMGVPGNDNLLTAALSGTNTNSFVPEIPIGRLSAFTNSEVTIYLDKVKQHDTASAAEWKKRVLHFAGGNDATLADQLKGYLDSYAATISDTLFGGNVLTFSKNTTAPIQLNISDSIKNAISNGCSLLTFFGHGSEQGFDQAIDDPEQYDNKGKYPFVVANSCYSGNIHIYNRRSVSETFVFSNQKGSIGFLAATATGFVYALNIYTSKFYQALGRTKYNKGIGDVIKEACYQTALSNDSITRFTALDMTLHGDPSLKISNGPCPDYRIKNSDVSFDIKTHPDSVGISINMINLGSAVPDSIILRVERYFPNGDSALFLKRIRAPYFKKNITFYTLIDFSRGIGLNKFKVTIDDINEVNECLENNNSTAGTVDFFIPGGDILPVYPYKYAVVPKTTTITLKASTTDPFAQQNKYRFQLDTCDKFTSPIQTGLITSKGGVVEWTVSLPFQDSTVYFWRVSKDSTSAINTFSWKESSFQTINTKRGWAQAHFHQFKSDLYKYVTYKKELRQFKFEDTRNSVFCRTGIYPAIYPTNIAFYFNNLLMNYWSCAPDGWNFVVFDSISGLPQEVKSITTPSPGVGLYNNCVCATQVFYVHSFGEYSWCGAANWKLDVQNFLNSVAPNNYVLAFTVGYTDSNARVSKYTNEMYNAFESIGAVHIRDISDTVPYILFGRKGMVAGQGHEASLKKVNKNSIITLNDTMVTKWNNGYVASEIIGPSFKWNSLHWRVKSLEAPSGDTTVLKLVGIRNNGTIDTLATFPTDSMDVLALGNYANAAVHPYLKLVAMMKDNVDNTSPQLKRWQVLYDEAPECAINPLKGFSSINDTLMEGDVVTFRFPIENIGIRNFDDSLVITYWVEDNGRNKILLPQKSKPKPFIPGQVLIDTVKINSYQLAGMNALWLYVNPTGNTKYQKEQHQFNNIGRYAFKVDRDVTNPLLDVTFDGIRILNGDIVSAKPNILITLKDENRFLELNDTGAFTVFIQAPNQSTGQRIYFAQGLQFTPANLPKNSCAINYNPVLPLDGKYLLTVQAKDRSNNRSGVQSYRIEFEVNNKPTVTNVLNYPNPFSTSTKFVFTLTGSEVPEVFTIQIMTISGKVVKEITRGELGNLHIGRNITDYTWDGRDEFGDKVGNGVYLYKIITKLNGENIEKAGTAADKFFIKEFGKMVIMR